MLLTIVTTLAGIVGWHRLPALLGLGLRGRVLGIHDMMLMMLDRDGNFGKLFGVAFGHQGKQVSVCATYQYVMFTLKGAQRCVLLSTPRRCG